MATTPELEAELKKEIYLFTQTGFYEQEDILEEIQDLFYETPLKDAYIMGLIREAFKTKRTEEQTYPKVTDCDRLADAFDDLYLQHSILAMHLAGFTESEGEEDVSDWFYEELEAKKTPKGYCFYHQQDVDALIEGETELHLSFGDFKINKEGEISMNKNEGGASIAIGKRIVEVLIQHGFSVTWNETLNSRIQIKPFKWQKRLEL